MAKYYFRLLLLVAAVIAIFWVIGSLLPRSYSFSTNIDIAAAPEEIFPKLDNLKEWQTWSRQWNPKEIEGLEISYNSQPAGVGAAQTWSDIRGKGKLWITESRTNDSIKYEMTFGNFPKMTSRMTLTKTETITNVEWSSEGRLPGGPFYGFFGSFFSVQMRDQYDKSLAHLKEIVEAEKGNSIEQNLQPKLDESDSSALPQNPAP